MRMDHKQKQVTSIQRQAAPKQAKSTVKPNTPRQVVRRSITVSQLAEPKTSEYMGIYCSLIHVCIAPLNCLLPPPIAIKTKSAEAEYQAIGGSIRRRGKGFPLRAYTVVVYNADICKYTCMYTMTQEQKEKLQKKMNTKHRKSSPSRLAVPLSACLSAATIYTARIRTNPSH